jgi:arginyl-tRNA synthetase
VATAIVDQLAADPAFTALCLPPQIAGPGFINFTLRPEALVAEVASAKSDKDWRSVTMCSGLQVLTPVS